MTHNSYGLPYWVTIIVTIDQVDILNWFFKANEIFDSCF